MSVKKTIVQSFQVVGLLPHLFFFNNVKNKEIIHYDTKRWMLILGIEKGLQAGFLDLMIHYPEFRNVYYYRLGRYANWISFMYKRMNTLFICTPNIGPGLFIQHGFATMIAAKAIGKNCWINQQVTLGFTNATDSPVIKDNVTIGCGAKILGDLTVEDNCIIGANAVVVKNVPENCTVAGVPARIIKRNGVRIKELTNQ